MVTLGFQVDSAGDVDALFAKLKGLGYKVDRTPWKAPWGTRYAIVYDPDGNLVEIYHPSALRSRMRRGEGAHGDAGAGGAVVVVGSPAGDGAPQRCRLEEPRRPRPMPGRTRDRSGCDGRCQCYLSRSVLVPRVVLPALGGHA